MSLFLRMVLCLFLFPVVLTDGLKCMICSAGLPMKDILQPAISYARDGFPVTEVIAYSLKKGTDILKNIRILKSVYAKWGKAPSKGEIFKNPLLANTLEKIVKGGRYEFYRGTIARDIDAFMKKQGGFLSYDDMSRHHSEWVEPVSTTYRGYEVWELPQTDRELQLFRC